MVLDVVDDDAATDTCNIKSPHGESNHSHVGPDISCATGSPQPAAAFEVAAPISMSADARASDHCSYLRRRRSAEPPHNGDTAGPHRHSTGHTPPPQQQQQVSSPICIWSQQQSQQACSPMAIVAAGLPVPNSPADSCGACHDSCHKHVGALAAAGMACYLSRHPVNIDADSEPRSSPAGQCAVDKAATSGHTAVSIPHMAHTSHAENGCAGQQHSTQDPQETLLGSTHAAVVAKLQPKAPSLTNTLLVLPWEVVPFILGMFILVEGLNVNGWIDKLASWLGGSATSLPMALFVMGSVSILLSNVINNQPMTILMTRVCLNPKFVAAVGNARNVEASLFAVVVGSNLAANFTLIGALAGMMWANILAQRGLHIGYVQFARLTLPAGVLCTAVCLVVLGLEFLIFV